MPPSMITREDLFLTAWKETEASKDVLTNVFRTLPINYPTELEEKGPILCLTAVRWLATQYGVNFLTTIHREIGSPNYPAVVAREWNWSMFFIEQDGELMIDVLSKQASLPPVNNTAAIFAHFTNWLTTTDGIRFVRRTHELLALQRHLDRYVEFAIKKMEHTPPAQEALAEIFNIASSVFYKR